MTVPVHARLRVGGLLYGDALWSIGVNYLGPGGQDPFSAGTADVQGALEAWAEGVKAGEGGNVLTSSMRALLSTQGVVNTVRCSRIGTDGKESAVAQITLVPAVAGTGQYNQDVQTALVASLSTGRPGPSYRGRLYLPAIGGNVSQYGAVGSPTTTAVSSDVSSWLQDVGALLLPSDWTSPCRAAVISSKLDAGTLVTAVRVGNRFDSQRRRRGGEQETYSSTPVA